MSRSVRTSLVLFALAAALLGYIVLVDRGGVSSGELEQRKGSAIPEFVRARVSKLEVQRRDQLTVIERDLGDTNEGGLWHVVQPYRARADQEAVNTLLSGLEMLDTRRRIEHVTASDRKQFGLDSPRYRVWFGQGKLRIPLVVGADSARGDGVYVQSSDPTVAFVAGRDLLEDLERDPTDYHEKELHDGVLLPTLLAISIRDASGTRSLRKHDDGTFWLEQPSSALASQTVVSGLVDALDALRAKHFVAQSVRDFSPYGLDTPRFELEVRKKRWLEGASGAAGQGASSKPLSKEVSLRVRVGKACPEHKGESYLAVGDEGVVVCALDSELTKLPKSFEELREPALLPLPDDQVEGVELEQGGARLVLRKSKDGFDYETQRGGKTVRSGRARAGSVAEWLKALRDSKATRFDAAAPSLSPPASAITLRIVREKPKPPWLIRVWSGGADVLATRGEEAQAAAFPPSVLDLLTVEAARFREAPQLPIDEHSLQRLEIERGNQVERVARSKDGPGFVLEAPLLAPADELTVSETLRALSAVSDARFVSDERRAEHRLSSPAIRVTVAAGEERASTSASRKVLEVGGTAPSGERFASFGGEQGVFALPDSVVAKLQAPLVSRTLLATPLERIATIAITRGTRRARIERSSAGICSATGDLALLPGTPAALCEAVATLRAAGVTGYGAPSREQGFATPQFRLEVASTDPATKPYVLTLGAETDDHSRFARREDLPVTFVLSRASVDALTSAAAR